MLFQEDFPVDLENCITLDELEEDDSDDQGIPGSLVMLNTKTYCCTSTFGWLLKLTVQFLIFFLFDFVAGGESADEPKVSVTFDITAEFLSDMLLI